MQSTQMTATGRTIVKELVVRASPERAYRAFTEKAELERWFVTRADVDLRPGGVYDLTWEPDSRVPGRVVELDPPRRFVFDWDDGPKYGITRITVDFEPADDERTRIRLVHTGFSTNPDWDPLYLDVTAGWTKELEYLRDWLDSGKAKEWPTATAQRA
ncbi:MAG: hypothetical protein DCC58_08175 [Chloroflexi bacterium]|nr:MAG: hypothetical protein DCC58_08175 [Chloroflexota bacterium]